MLEPAAAVVGYNLHHEARIRRNIFNARNGRYCTKHKNIASFWSNARIICCGRRDPHPVFIRCFPAVRILCDSLRAVPAHTLKNGTGIPFRILFLIVLKADQRHCLIAH